MAKKTLTFDRDEAEKYPDPMGLVSEIFDFVFECRGNCPRLEGFLRGLHVAGLVDKVNVKKEEA